MRAAFEREFRDLIEIIGAFKRPADGAAIVMGQNAHLGGHLALANALQGGPVLLGRFFQPGYLRMARFITANDPFSV
jgi:hypothetical protein